ncbi:MAG: 5'-AMP-activated protein kinase subunit gamma-1 [Candelina submexicana]|nr:MAG: 5'-AMP-activated protein kinase subunit gamma-1 [Candelina submexicana]
MSEVEPEDATKRAQAANAHDKVPSNNASSKTSSPVVGHEGFVQPSSYLRPRGYSRPITPAQPLNPIDREQIEGLRAIRAFLKVRTSYDVLPLSFRLIVFDTTLLVKKSLNTLIHNDIEKAIGVTPIETVSIHPLKPLYEACRRMLESRARRIPLIDGDDETSRGMVVSVVTQYRILKFVAVNVSETQMLRKPLRDLNVGTYDHVQTAYMDTPVMDVIHLLVKKNISNVPILNNDGVVINVFEAVDVITLIKGGFYDDLNLTDFAGIYTCSVNDRLDTIFDTIRKSRVHRFVIIDHNYRLKGVLTLSDILEYILLEGEDSET